MPPQFPDFRRIRRRVKRSLNYGLKKNATLNLPLQDMVLNYFERHCPFDYMRPEISANISHRGYADPCSLIVAMIYLDRLRTTDQEFFETSDPADLYLPALVLASKYLHDSDTWDRATNSEWAEAADIEPEHLNTLEWDFIKRLNWNTIVQEDEFDTVLHTVEGYVANYKVEQNGVATYNELYQLANHIPGTSYMAMLQDFLSFMGFVGLLYTVTLMSVLAIPSQIEKTETENASTSQVAHENVVLRLPVAECKSCPPGLLRPRPSFARRQHLAQSLRNLPSDALPTIASLESVFSSYVKPPITPFGLSQAPPLDFGADYGIHSIQNSFKHFNQNNLTETCS